MCGIICYMGKRPAVPILLDGLRRLEYRGYDSAGIAVFNNGSIDRVRALGKIRELEDKLDDHRCKSWGGIAHTRWATHGAPSEINAHPHCDNSGRIFLIHNGIIENYQQIKERLLDKGYHFESETDTEVLTQLIADCYKGDLGEAVTQALRQVRGAFGIAVISRQEPGKMVVARRGSPLIIGLREGEIFAASDVAALVNHTKKVVYLEDNDIAVLTPDQHDIFNLDDADIRRMPETVDWDVDAAEKQGFPHFMLKEIFEQPQAVQNAMRGRLIEDEGTVKLGGLEPVLKRFLNMDRLIIVSCGTSFYAGLIGRYIVEHMTEIGVDVDLASEFRYRRLNLKPGTVVLAISQSGETADTLAAVREAKRKGVLVLGLVNVVGSNIARETAAGVYNHAGPEIGVASTKAFTSQVAVLYLLCLMLGRRHRMSLTEGKQFIETFRTVPEKMDRILHQADRIESLAQKYSRYSNYLFLGRQLNYPVALEGALKLKEISYRHAEGYAAGEMKHGPIALIDQDFPTICIAPRDSSYEKMISNMQEIKARGGPILGIVTEGDRQMRELCDDVIEVPQIDDLFTPFMTTIPLQLLAYYIARENGCEIDQPRNLAKSVTVE
ncbi:MAG TPA: glutamine--fructose-6-phosphate transaminase (isomerizing) [Acidobacteriota bacterium]|nr:glutamine--fructose-6-phosphate transaminase (isomerizing) [Acidobacteriota bacterium]